MHDLSDYVRTFLYGPYPDRMTAIRTIAARHGERSMLITTLDGASYGRPWSVDNVDGRRWPADFAIISTDDVSALCRPVEKAVSYFGDPSFFPFEDWVLDDDCIDVLDVVETNKTRLLGGNDKT